MINRMPPVFGFLGDIGAGEILIILAAILILFGGKGLPAMARKLGQITRDLQKATHDFKRQFLTADYPPPDEAPKSPPHTPDQDDPKP